MATPEKMRNEKVNIPNAVILLPNPKYFEITSKLGEIRYCPEFIKATIVIKSNNDRIEVFLVLLSIMIN